MSIPSPRRGMLASLPSLLLVALVALTQVQVQVQGQVTVYGVVPLGQATLTATATDSAAAAAQSTLPAYDKTVLTPPPPPDPAIGRVALNVQQRAQDVPRLSIPHATGAAFFGFSVEMSVITQTIGKNSTHIFPVFLNLMSNIAERGGNVMVRLGGNTQEFAKYHDGRFEDGRITQKEKSGSQQTTETPAVMYTIDMFYMCANISSLVNVKWYLGLPFNDLSTWHLEIAEYGQQIIGDNLLALQAGNEPDLYARHAKRPPTYGVSDYIGELHEMIDVVEQNPLIPVKNKFIAPSISSSGWSPEQVWETGFIDTFKDRLFALTVERYPDNNCFMQFGVGTFTDPQVIFPRFLRHDTQLELMSEYTPSTALAIAANLPFLMFETNTGSCGGFPGLSQSFGSALWGLDYGLSMANANFSNALLHIGGQNVFYNPWISPPTNQTAFNQWTVGSIFYSALVMAEVFGPGTTSRIIDLTPTDTPGGVFTPAYAIYEDDVLSRFALINFASDPSGASDVTFDITVEGGGTVPAEVKVKYLTAESVAAKENIRWAGQTFGNNFEADGRLKGDLDIVTVQCNTQNNTCPIPLRAPSFALVFLRESEGAGGKAANLGQATATYATTAHTRQHNTIAIDPTEVARSNGHNASQRAMLGSTSHGSVSGAVGMRERGDGVVGMSVLVGCVVVGAWVVVRGVLGN